MLVGELSRAKGHCVTVSISLSSAGRESLLGPLAATRKSIFDNENAQLKTLAAPSVPFPKSLTSNFALIYILPWSTTIIFAVTWGKRAKKLHLRPMSQAAPEGKQSV
jgi:hypothetical protein